MSLKREERTDLPQAYEITQRLKHLEDCIVAEEERINDIIAVITEMVEKLYG